MPVYLFEHANMNVTTNGIATKFYLEGLGFARDPRREDIVHANIGLSQFHLLAPYDKPQILRGHYGLLYDSLDALRERLSAVPDLTNLGDCKFSMDDSDEKCLRVIGPYGNEFRCYEAPEGYRQEASQRGSHPGDESWGVGMLYVELKCPLGTSDGLRRCYENLFGATVVSGDGRCATDLSVEDLAGNGTGNDDTEGEGQSGKSVRVMAGTQQYISFREDANVSSEDGAVDLGYHLCIYVSDFVDVYHRFESAGLVWNNPRFRDYVTCWEDAEQESQFRVRELRDARVDVGEEEEGQEASGGGSSVVGDRVLLMLEHEVRSTLHPACPLRVDDAAVPVTTAQHV